MDIIDERMAVAPEVLETYSRKELFKYERSVMDEYRKVDWVVMQYMMIFMIDFIATWFTPYSKLLAGDNRKVSYSFETILLSFHSNYFTKCVIELWFDLWLLCEALMLTQTSDINLEATQPYFSYVHAALYWGAVY
jgi:hypothetical protein